MTVGHVTLCLNERAFQVGATVRSGVFPKSECEATFRDAAWDSVWSTVRVGINLQSSVIVMPLLADSLPRASLGAACRR